MLEILSFLIAAAIIGFLSRPLIRGRSLPSWLERARLRGRPGVPVTAWLGAFLLMLLVWLIGDQRGFLALLLWLVWTCAPLAAAWVTWLWVDQRRRVKSER